MAVPRQVHLFDRPTRFVAGTVGQPGDRTFYLQATDETGRTVSVALEKTQVQVLADRMSELLDEIAERAGAGASTAAGPPAAAAGGDGVWARAGPAPPRAEVGARAGAGRIGGGGGEAPGVGEGGAAPEEPSEENTIHAEEGPSNCQSNV